MTSLSIAPVLPTEKTDRGWLLVFICWIALAVAWSIPNLATLATFTGSTDDTMRLVQVRGLLDGHGWYGMHEARLDPPRGLDSHWSRLVDLPIAALILLGRPIFGMQGAETFALIAWPALVYLAMMVGFVLVGLRLAPKAGPLPMIAAFIACLPVMNYFKPLAIDHHNVQMALAVLLMAAAVWAADNRAAAILGGLCGAVTVAIGFESLHVLVAVELLVIGLALFGGVAERRAARLWLLAQGIAIVPIYLINTPPTWWLRTGCDALQMNMAVMLSFGSLMVAALLRLAGPMPALRLTALVALVSACALGLGAGLDPACLAGPNARVAPEAVTLWMNYVQEAEPWRSLLSSNTGQAIMFMVYPVLALLAGAILAVRRQLDAPVLVLLAVTLIATLVMLTQVRGFTYAAITGAIVVAVTACRLFPDGKLAPIQRMAISAVLPVLCVLVPVLLLPSKQPQAASSSPAASGTARAIDQRRVEEICEARAGFEPLRTQPEGLVLGHIDLGPAMLLNTGHSVVMAPYHRADMGIVLGFTLMATPIAEARAKLAEAGITYLAECTRLADAIDRTVTPQPLRDAALGKIKVDWLEALPADPAFPEMRFWKITR
jgi:hypothetical protein